MLKNMKTRNSLLLGYGITIGISVILILICLLMMLNIKGKYDVLLDKDAAANQDILYCRVNALLVGRNIRDSYLAPDGGKSAGQPVCQYGIVEGTFPVSAGAQYIRRVYYDRY